MPAHYIKTLLIPVLFMLLVLAFPFVSNATTQYTISGSGYAAPLGTHPPTTVNVYYKPTMELMGQATTDANGNYTVIFYSVGIENHATSGLSGIIIQNPYQKKLEIEVSVQETAVYSLTVSDVNGCILLMKSITLQGGFNTLTVSGLGSSGLKTIQISGCGQKITLKAIQGSSGAFSPSVNVTHSDVPLLKNAATSDSLLVSFIPPSGYIGMDTTVTFQSQTVNYVLQQIPTYVINTTFNPLDVNGNFANVILSIAWSDSVLSYSPSSDQKIHINKNIYGTSSVGIITVDTNVNRNYTPWVIGMREDAATNDTNIFQNPKENGTVTTNNPPQPVHVNFADTNINNKEIYAFFLQSKVPNPLGAQGDSIYTFSLPIRQMMSTRNGGVKTTKYIDVNIDSLLPFYKLQLGYAPYNNASIPTAQTDRQKALSEKTDSLSPIPNTTIKLFPDATFHFAQNNNDQIVQHCANRDDQYTYMYFFSGGGNPGDGVTVKTTYTYNGEWRASIGTIEDNQNDTDGIVFAEYYKGKTTVADPTSGTAGPWIWSQSTYSPTELAKFMARALRVLNLNTKYY